MALLEKLWREHGLTMVVFTHETAIANRALRIGVMSKGRLTIRSSPGATTGYPAVSPGALSGQCSGEPE